MKTRAKFSKQILSIALCLAMLLSWIPMMAYAATEAPVFGQQEGISYTDGATQYVQYNHYLYKVTYTNLKGIQYLGLGYAADWEYLTLNYSGYYTWLTTNTWHNLYLEDLPETVGGVLNLYSANKSVDQNKPVVIITCVAVNDPVWSWDGFSAKAVFTSTDGNATMTVNATVSSSVTPAETCLKKEKTTYTAKATCNGQTYTDTKTVDGDPGPHSYTYSASGNTVTEGCSNNCGHSATATLTATNQFYTGSAITSATITYSEGWAGSKHTEIGYTNNTNVGVATATITVEGQTLSTTFQIIKSIYAVTWSNGDGGSYEQNVAIGTTITVPTSEIFKETVRKGGYDITGWTASDPIYNIGAAMPEKDLTFTAQYTPAALTGTVTVSGATEVGQTLTATVTGSNNTGDLSYQWYRTSATPHVEISGAKNNTYTLTAADAGWTLYCVVTSSIQTGSITSEKSTNIPRLHFADDDITAEGYIGTYDGQYHGITVTVPEGATVQYAEDLYPNGPYYDFELDAKNAGTYTIHYVVSKTGYYPKFGSEVIQIEKACLDVAAGTLYAEAGDACPTPSYTITGFVNSENESAITGVPTLSYSETPDMSKTGTYTINVDTTGMSATNYYFSGINGSLTVLEHVHNFTGYYLSDEGDTIYGTCSKDECPDGGTVKLITLVAPTDAVYEQGTHHTASIEGYDPQAQINSETIIYTKDGIETNPVEAGTYIASYTYEGVTASVEYEIEKAILTITAKSYMIKTGDAVPDLTASDAYTVDGLTGDDDASVLSDEIKLCYSNTPDNTEEGYYLICFENEPTADNYYVYCEGGDLRIVECIHDFTEYYLGAVNEENDSIFAKCSKGCEEYGNGGVIATLCAPEDAVYEQGLYHNVSIGYDSQVDIDPESVVYSADPVDAGTYTASYTYEGVTASVTYTVAKRSLIITADDKTVYVGSNAPEYTYTVSGWSANHDEEDEFSHKVSGVTAVCEDANLNRSGAYAITISGTPVVLDSEGNDVSANYELTAQNRVLTVQMLETVENVEELIDKLPENITKDDETAIKAAEDAYNALTDYEKSLVDENAKKALDDAKAALAELSKPAASDSPKTGDTTIDGITNDDKETEQEVVDESDGLSGDEELTDDEELTGDKDAALEEIEDDAEELTVKGEDVTDENVTPEDKTDSENAKTDLAEPNKPADTNNPQTGDNSNLCVWFALLFLSSAAILAIAVNDRKRKAVE